MGTKLLREVPSELFYERGGHQKGKEENKENPYSAHEVQGSVHQTPPTFQACWRTPVPRGEVASTAAPVPQGGAVLLGGAGFHGTPCRFFSFFLSYGCAVQATNPPSDDPASFDVQQAITGRGPAAGIKYPCKTNFHGHRWHESISLHRSNRPIFTIRGSRSLSNPLLTATNRFACNGGEQPNPSRGEAGSCTSGRSLKDFPQQEGQAFLPAFEPGPQVFCPLPKMGKANTTNKKEGVPRRGPREPTTQSPFPWLKTKGGASPPPPIAGRARGADHPGKHRKGF